LIFRAGGRLRAKLWPFILGTGARLLSWVFVALILTAFTQWANNRNKAPARGTQLNGTERPANLSRLNDDLSESDDPAEQSNTQNFAIANDVEEVKVDYEVFLNPDCSPKTNFYLYVREKPLHGSVRIDLDKNYTGYDSDSQRYKCNLTPTQSPSIFYTRNKGFIGKDAFTVEVFDPGGYVRATRYLIDAR